MDIGTKEHKDIGAYVQKDIETYGGNIVCAKPLRSFLLRFRYFFSSRNFAKGFIVQFGF